MKRSPTRFSIILIILGSIFTINYPSLNNVYVDAASGVSTSDKYGNSDQSLIAISSENDPPEIINPGDQTNDEGDSIALQIIATDPNGDPLEYIAFGLPSGLTINTTTGLISGTVANNASHTSPYDPVTVTVTDPSGESDSTEFVWWIQPDFNGSENWTLMYYQAWDNDLDGPLNSEINTLRNASNNPNIFITVFRDYRNQSPVYEAYVDGQMVVNLSKDELNTGDSQTLSDFIDWAKSNYPAKHYALVIVDHGNGLSGTSQDLTDSDWLDPQDFRAALQTSGPFDVIFLEDCLSANLEHAYQARDETMYYVASEARMVAPLNHQYLNQISSQTSARELAETMAMAYDAQYNVDGQSRTISVGDMSKIEQVAQSTIAFASAIRSHRVDLGIAIWQLITGNTVQRFEENRDGIINENDILADLYHFAQLVGWLGEPDLTVAANNLMTAIDEYIVYNSTWSRGTWDHDNAYGLSIILTRNPACYYTSDWFDFAGNVSWFCDQNIQMIEQENGEWGQMLSDLITDNNPDPQPQFEAPPLIPLDIYLTKIYLPLSVKH